MNHNKLGTEFVEILCKEILEDARYSLETLNLEDCSLTDESANIFGDVLIKNDNLRCLNLSRNGFTYKGMEDFCKDLHKSVLTVLMLHWNPIGAKGGQFLAKALHENEVL